MVQSYRPVLNIHFCQVTLQSGTASGITDTAHSDGPGRRVHVITARDALFPLDTEPSGVEEAGNQSEELKKNVTSVA